MDKLPRLVLRSDETVAVSHAQRLLAVMHYAGPQLLVDHLLRSPVSGVYGLWTYLISCLLNSFSNLEIRKSGQN